MTTATNNNNKINNKNNIKSIWHVSNCSGGMSYKHILTCTSTHPCNRIQKCRTRRLQFSYVMRIRIYIPTYISTSVVSVCYTAHLRKYVVYNPYMEDILLYHKHCVCVYTYLGMAVCVDFAVGCACGFSTSVGIADEQRSV